MALKTSYLRSPTPVVRHRWQVFVYSLLALVILAGVVLQGATARVAYADDDADGAFEEAAQSYLKDNLAKDKNGNTQFDKTMDNTRGDWKNKDSFGYIMWRLFTLNYINETEHNAQGHDAVNCHVDHKFAGTPLYHNCDVPNMLTETVQDAIGFFIPEQLTYGANATSNQLWLPQFGLSSDIPLGGAPVDPSKRAEKYTALELFGYNLRYTNYYGEWDHIDTLTGARMMQNFGLTDRLKTGVMSVINGVGGAFSGASQGWSEGDGLFSKIGGAIVGFFEGGTSASINTFLDTSDQNVFDVYGWYRVGFPRTTYGAREATSEEQMAMLQIAFSQALVKTLPESAKPPEGLQAVESPPPLLGEAVSSCTYTDHTQSPAKSVTEEGLTKEECDGQANAKRGTNPSNPATFKEDGTKAAQTLSDWKAKNKKYVDAISEYNIGVELGDDEANAAETIKTLVEAWPEAYAAAVTVSITESNNLIFSLWMSNTVSSMFEEMLQSPETNFNAPWNRYICVDSEGNDVRDSSGNLMYVYRADGTVNYGCKELRPPIQDGMFGNGYTVNPPGHDDRHTDAGKIVNYVASAVFPDVSGSALSVSAFVTRISNTAMSLAFSPVLETLGIRGIVEKGMTTFRDSIFFPLALIMIALLGIQVVWRALTRGDFKGQMLNAAAGAGVFGLGVVLMFNPAFVLDAVDKAPSAVERTIVGHIFSLGNDAEDILCTASKGGSGEQGQGLRGESLPYDHTSGVRSMLCENWRTFAFNPWVAGQFGVNMKNLYAADSGAPNAWTNNNKHLVGDAGVNMGGGQTMHNWAVYQLQATSYGTASYEDNSAIVSGNDVKPDFYRIVDAQAGPNNSKDSYGKYFNTWTGMEGSRTVYALISVPAAVLGAIAVTMYSIAKIQVTFVVTIMLMVLPLMILFGLLQGQTRNKFRSYIATLVGLVFQRILYVLLLAVMFRILTSIGTSSDEYLTTAVMSMVVCAIFIMYRKEFEDMMNRTVEEGIGAPSMREFASNPRQALASAQIRPPRLISNAYESVKQRTVGYTSGFAAGLAMGEGVKGARDLARSQSQFARNREWNRQRSRVGFSGVQNIMQAAEEGRREAWREQVADDDFKSTAADLQRESMFFDDARKRKEEALAVWDDLELADPSDPDGDRINPYTHQKMSKNEFVNTYAHARSDTNVYSGDLNARDRRVIKRITRERKRAQKKFDTVRRKMDAGRGDIDQLRETADDLLREEAQREADLRDLADERADEKRRAKSSVNEYVKQKEIELQQVRAARSRQQRNQGRGKK